MNEKLRNELLEGLLNSQLFMNMEKNTLSEFCSITRLRFIRADEQIFSDGEKAEGFYIIKKGKVKIYKLSAAGKIHIIHIFGPGSPFGEAAVFMQNRFPAYAAAITDCDLIYIKFDDFLKHLKKDPQFALNIIATLCIRLKTFLNAIEELSLNEVSTRLAKYLIQLATPNNTAHKNNLATTALKNAIIDSNTDTAMITLNIKKNILAGQLGTIPETLSRTFSKLKKQGIIQINGKTITILSLKKLSSLFL